MTEVEKMTRVAELLKEAFEILKTVDTHIASVARIQLDDTRLTVGAAFYDYED